MIRFYLLAIFVLLLSCNNGKNKPDVSNIKVDMQLERFEKDFFAIDTNNISEGLADLRNGYPQFYPVFIQDILQINPQDTASFFVIRQILSGYRGIYDSLSAKYKSLEWLRSELTQNFRYVKYYYPDYPVPNLITFIGTLDAPGVVLTDKHLGIGLHQYAGKDFSVYHTEQVLQLYPTYISRRFDKEYIVANALKAVVDDIYPDKTVGRPLIEQMIEKGKQWYLLDHFLPDAPDSVKTGYTQNQLKWVEKYEGDIWANIISNVPDLYTVDPVTIQTYIGEAPFTQGMPEASPGNIGQWIGWRIVQKFAANKNLSVQEVVQTDARKILGEAKYKPK